MNDLAAPSKLQPALIGGVLLGVLSAVPFVSCACCLWIIAGGVLATYLYQNNCPFPVQYGDGAVLGLLTGLFGGVVETILSIPLRLLGWGATATALQDALRKLESDPNVPQELLEFLRAWLTEGGLLAVGIVGFIMKLALFAIIAMVGAIIGVAIFQKRGNSGATPSPTAPPPAAPPPSAPPAPPAE